MVAGETLTDEERQIWRGLEEEHEREYQLLVRLERTCAIYSGNEGNSAGSCLHKQVARRLERGKQRKIRLTAYISAVAGVLLVIGIALTWWGLPFGERRGRWSNRSDREAGR